MWLTPYLDYTHTQVSVRFDKNVSKTFKFQHKKSMRLHEPVLAITYAKCKRYKISKSRVKFNISKLLKLRFRGMRKSCTR